MGLVLDSTILIAAERKRFDLLAFYAAHANEELRISAITVSELLHGVERASTPERKRMRSQRVENYLVQLEAIDFDSTLARTHAAIWAQLEMKGQMIGAHDLIIAATALQFGDALATLNRVEFARVPGLQLTNTDQFALHG